VACVLHEEMSKCLTILGTKVAIDVMVTTFTLVINVTVFTAFLR
jgi:hypothetical protein